MELKRWAVRAGITKDITFHSGRHTFAVMMLDLRSGHLHGEASRTQGNPHDPDLRENDGQEEAGGGDAHPAAAARNVIRPAQSERRGSVTETAPCRWI